MATLGQYNLEEMTAQEVYEASAIHLLEQSRESVKDGVDCAYNGEGGLCCAAAIFVQNYTEKMEGGTWSRLISKFNQSDNHSRLVKRLQVIHDSRGESCWLDSLKELSEERPELNLDSSFLDAWKWSDEYQKYYKEG